MTERKPIDTSWESFVEQQIRDAQEAGQFDNLPGMGKPIPDLDEPYDELWWIKKKIRRENLSLLPPSLQIRVELSKTLTRIWQLADEVAVREQVAQLNQKIRQANYASLWGPPSTVSVIDADEVVREWQQKRST